METLTRGQMAKNKLEEIKYLLKTGEIDHAEAQKQSKEHLKIMNEEMEKISKGFGMKHRAISFQRFMR